MYFREMRGRLIASYGRFVFFPQDPESQKIVSTRAFTHLVIDEDITLYAPRIMEKQLEAELNEDYEVVYGEPELKGAYYVSPQTMAANLNFQWRSGEGILKKAMKKPFYDENEIIKEGAERINRAMEKVWEEMKVGMRESEVAGIIDANLRREGVSGVAYPTIVSTGKRSKHPVPATGNEKIEEGKIVYIDVFPEHFGYVMNFSRVVFTDERKEWIDALERINRMYESLNLKPGTSLRMVDSRIRSVGDFPHYSVVPAGGFYCPFAPGDGVLEENMLFTIVPSIYLKEGVIRVKRTVILRDSGPEFLI